MPNREHLLWEAARAHCIFYDLPTVLDYESIDPLLRDAVKRINESNWVWTAESCQGHPDDELPHTWAGNTRPFLRLVCHRENYGEMLALLLDAMHQDPQPGLYPLDFENAVELYAQQRQDWRELLVYVRASTVWERNQGVQVFDRFAEAVNNA